MKNLFTLTTALIMCGYTLAVPQSLYITFDGTDNALWSTGNASTNTVSNGHLTCSMAKQSDGKYRGDLQYNATNNTSNDITLIPSNDQLFALKFIGQRPSGKIKLEINDGSTWMNTQWNGGNPDGSAMTYGGNNVYYFRLSKDSKYSGDTYNLRRLNVIIADTNSEPYSYTIDWVATFATLTDLNNHLSTKDDGNADVDESTYVPSPIQNQHTGAGYSTLNDAVAAAETQQTLVLNNDANITSRIDVESKEITIIAQPEGAKIKRGAGGTNIMLLTKNSSAAIILGGQGGPLTLDGTNTLNSSNFIEASNGGTVTINNNVEFLNCISTSIYGPAICVKNNGKLALNGASFNGCKTVDANSNPIDNYGIVFVGTTGVTLSNNNTFNNCNGGFFIEANYTLSASALTNTTPLSVRLQKTADRTEKRIIMGCSDPSKFSLYNNGYSLVADAENLKIDISSTITSTQNKEIKIVQAKDGIIISSPKQQTTTIHSITGTLIQIIHLNEGETQLPNLPKGIYLIGKSKFTTH